MTRMVFDRATRIVIEDVTVVSPGKVIVGEAVECSWGEFCDDNMTDVVSDVAEQLAAGDSAELGGGAEPYVWIFPL